MTEFYTVFGSAPGGVIQTYIGAVVILICS